MDAPDVVYVVRRGHTNEELRHSLRSLANLPHRRVWIAGFIPRWVRGVGRIPVAQKRSKYLNSTANLRAALEHPQIADEFLLFNDDFFVMRPLTEMPILHRGPIQPVIDLYRRIDNGPYVRGMEQTRDLLVELGHPDPLSYELHVPLPVRREAMLEALDLGRRIQVLHKRTLYGNLARLGGTRSPDVKVASAGAVGYQDWPFISTLDWVFDQEPVGSFIRDRFPEPSPYEGNVLTSRCRGLPSLSN